MIQDPGLLTRWLWRGGGAEKEEVADAEQERPDCPGAESE